MAEEKVFEKTVNSAFIGTDLDAYLKEIDAQHVVMFGLTTDMCVSTSARMGANLGWKITLAADACSCHDHTTYNGSKTISADDIQAAHLATLAAEFVDVLKTEEIIALIEDQQG